jgi:hypothetical protein
VKCKIRPYQQNKALLYDSNLLGLYAVWLIKHRASLSFIAGLRAVNRTTCLFHSDR